MDEIQSLINNANSTINLPASLDNYASVKDAILQIELQQEVDALTSMLLDLKTFEAAFRARCLWRERHREENIPFSDMPESPSNQLYWNIAKLFFNPDNMGEMLNIILPSIKTCLEISIPDIAPYGIKSSELRAHG